MTVASDIEARRGIALPLPAGAAPVLLCFAAALALALLRGIPSPEWLVAGLGNDSAMRLVTVRDLLGGQGWFDPHQARLGPHGTAMHWSRVVDAPMAGLILLLEPILGRAGAEHALLVLWPILMLAGAGAACASIGRAALGPPAGALAALCAILVLGPHTRYGSGDIDHHSLQLLLLLIALRGAMDGARAWAAAGGLAMAASLAVGVESLPLLCAVGVWVALRWAMLGEAARAQATRYGIGLAAGLAALFPLTAPAMAWRGGYCDALSVDLVAPVLAGALLLAGLAARASQAGRAYRAAGLALGGALIGAGVLLAIPACLSNPYDALHPLLREAWLSTVSEALGIGAVIDGRLSIGIGFLFAIGAISVAAAGLSRQRPLALPALLCALALGMMAYQIRSGLYVAALAALVLGTLSGHLIGEARRLRAPRPASLAILCFALALPSLWLKAHAMLPAEASEGPRRARAVCAAPGAWDALAALPQGTVAGGIDLGAAILVATPHTVLGAPYHRNEAGMLAQMSAAFAPGPAEARAALEAAGARYVAICAGSAERRGHASAGRTGFFADLEAGRVPSWLRPVATGGQSDLRVYALR